MCFNVYIKDVIAGGQEDEHISDLELSENTCFLHLFCSKFHHEYMFVGHGHSRALKKLWHLVLITVSH